MVQKADVHTGTQQDLLTRLSLEKSGPMARLAIVCVHSAGLGQILKTLFTDLGLNFWCVMKTPNLQNSVKTSVFCYRSV